tara:strand:- start:2258 stop:2473 length:216 start_codon:yes stop_codon:yes gene_type:complete
MRYFGSYLAEMRREKGLSQRALAKEIGVSQPACQAWETGKAKPSLKNLFSLQEVLGLDLEHCAHLLNKDSQ